MESIDAFFFGIWFGLTGPLVIHTLLVLLEQSHARASIWFVRLIRFIIAPLVVLGCFGNFAVMGSNLSEANYIGGGMFLALAVYALAYSLYRNARPKSDT